MKLGQRLQTAYKILTSQNLGNSISGQVLRNYQQGSAFNPTRQLYGITYKAIDKIGMAVADYEPLVEKKNGDTLENHPLYNLAKQPNPHQNGHYFFHLEAMLYEIYGESFWYKVRGERTNKVKELYLLNPAAMELVFGEGELQGYVLHKPNGQQVPFTIDEIHHDKRPNPFNEWRGMSVLEKASQYVDIELTTTSFTLNYMRNNASPSGIVSLPDMDRDTFKQFAAQWREGYEGPENAGKTAFIRGGEADFKAVGATLKDIDQKITRDMAKDDVLMMFDMPKGLLGASGDKGLGRAETEALEYIFAKYKVEPMMERLDEIFEGILVEMGVSDSTSEVTHISTIPDDKQYILSQNEKGVGRWITINEARQSQGLPPIPDGDELGSPPAPTNETKAKKVTLKKKLTKAEMTKKINQDQEEFRRNLVETNDIYAKKYKSKLVTFLGNQEDEIIEKIGARKKAFEEWLFDIKNASEDMRDALLPVILELMEAQGEDVSNFISGELLTISPEIRTKVEHDILRISGVFNTDTITSLERTLKEGQAQGESLVKLKKRVEEVYSEAKGYRAERIARTESLRASNETAEIVYQQSGYNKVEWFTNPGACEFCQTFSGKTKNIGSNFMNNGDTLTGADGGMMKITYDDIGTPPLHPNCTCSLVPV